MLSRNNKCIKMCYVIKCTLNLEEVLLFLHHGKVFKMGNTVFHGFSGARSISSLIDLEKTQGDL